MYSDWEALKSILYSKEHQDDILFDLKRAKPDLFQWKTHILRSINEDNTNQKCAKAVMGWKVLACCHGLGHEISSNEI